IKLAAEDLPLFQSIFIRGVAICALLFVLNRARGTLSGYRSHLTRPVGIRLATETIGTILYLSALTRVPLAEMTAVIQIVPVAVTFVAARMLREAVSARRVIAVIVGFLGVLLVVKPGTDSFSPWFLVGVLVVALIVVRELATRQIASHAPSLLIALFTGVTICTMGLLLSLFEGWEPLDARGVLLLVAAAGFLAIGYVASVATVRVGDLSFSAPFRYTVIIFSILLQIIVFRDVPDVWTFLGSAIVAAAGLFAFWSDRRPGPMAIRLRS
ncbi:MAG: DMT family transporter, partial [Acidimicrobiia bacterium]|nr:DMT family transporter [Acidimicrobiia bacterium]